MYTLKMKNISRDVLVLKLRDRGIGASVHFDPPVHLQPFYKKQYPDVQLPVTDQVAQSILTLPMYPGLTKQDLEYIVDTIHTIVKEIQ